MASTFGENKKLKHNQTPCRSWNNYIGLEKSNTGSIQLLSALRNTKTNSKSDESTDLSTTDQGNGQDTGQEGKEPTEDPGPDHRLIRSVWNEFCLVCCDKCDYFYAPQAFMWHLDVRHVQPQDLSVNQEPSVQQYRLYKKKPKRTRVPEHEKKGKVKNGKKNTTYSQNQRPLQTDNSKNNESEANTVDNLAVKSGPGPGDPPPAPGQGIDPLGKNKKKTKRKKGTNWTKGKKSQKIVLENCEEASSETVTKNFIKEPENRLLEVNYQLKGSQNCVVDVESLILPVTHGGFGQLEDGLHCGNSPSENLVLNQSTNSKMYSGPPLVKNIINSKAKDCSNSGTHLENTQSLFCKTVNVFSYNNKIIHDPRNKLNCHTDYPLPYNGTSEILNQRLNGNLKNAQRNNSVICVETRKSGFQNENNAYLKSVGDGSELSSRKCIRKTKPGVKLKRQRIKEKLKTALDTQCLQTIKLEPMKIKKALSSINRVCRARTIEQFRTFSHLKRIMPSGKNSPHRTRVSCSVNTGAKSACINSWNKVPFRSESRKCFFPLGGSLQAESGLVLSDSPYKTLRATFIQNELVSSPIQFQESDFVTIHPPYESTVEIEELNDERFATFELDIYDDQQNGSLPSRNANSPWDSNLVNDQPDFDLVNNQSDFDLMDCQPDSNLVNDQPDSVLVNDQPDSVLVNGQPDCVLVNDQPDSDLMYGQPDSVLVNGQPDSVLVNGQPDCVLESDQPNSDLMIDQADSDLMNVQPDSDLTNCQPDSNLVNVHQNSDLMNVLPDYDLLNVQPDSVPMNCQSDSDILDGQPDSGYLSQYDPDSNNEQHDPDYTNEQHDPDYTNEQHDPDSTNEQHMNGYSPISSSPEYYDEKRDMQQVKPGRQEDSQTFQEPGILKPQIICIYPKDFNRNENGIYQGYNREQNQGCTDR